jgi:plastocyanin
MLTAMRRWTMATVVAVAACHLADDPEPPKCEPGWEPINGRCEEKEVKEILARIGEDCSLTPDPFVVRVNDDFQFANDDDEPHTVTAIGGKLSTVLEPGEVSQYTQISKTGSYPYEVSGCPKGGTIEVQ